MPEPTESIEVLPSEDNGNIPAETPETPESTPKEEPQDPAAAAASAAPSTPTPAEPELYELPDGRKVDAATLSKEWKENFYPDYTRKSQALAAKNEPPADPNLNSKPTDPFSDPDFVPQSYAELAEAIEKRTLAQIEERERAVIAERTAIEERVSAELSEVKAIDPNLNESALFLHATKYGFNNLKTAYQNMKDMAALAKNVQSTTEKNILKRNDPVSASPGATGSGLNPSQFSTSVEYLRALGGK